MASSLGMFPPPFPAAVRAHPETDRVEASAVKAIAVRIHSENAPILLNPKGLLLTSHDLFSLRLITGLPPLWTGALLHGEILSVWKPQNTCPEVEKEVRLFHLSFRVNLRSGKEMGDAVGDPCGRSLYRRGGYRIENRRTARRRAILQLLIKTASGFGRIV